MSMARKYKACLLSYPNRSNRVEITQGDLNLPAISPRPDDDLELRGPTSTTKQVVGPKWEGTSSRCAHCHACNPSALSLPMGGWFMSLVPRKLLSLAIGKYFLWVHVG